MKKKKLSPAQIEQRREAGRIGGEASTPRKTRAVRKNARLGGEASTLRKTRAVRQNAKLGGRPGNPAIKRIMQERGVSRQRAWVIWKERQK